MQQKLRMSTHISAIGRASDCNKMQQQQEESRLALVCTREERPNNFPDSQPRIFRWFPSGSGPGGRRECTDRHALLFLFAASQAPVLLFQFQPCLHVNLRARAATAKEKGQIEMKMEGRRCEEVKKRGEAGSNIQLSLCLPSSRWDTAARRLQSAAHVTDRAQPRTSKAACLLAAAVAAVPLAALGLQKIPLRFSPALPHRCTSPPLSIGTLPRLTLPLPP